MKLPRGLLALIVVLLIVPAGVAISRSPLGAPTAGNQASEKTDAPKGSAAARPGETQPAMIEGKTIDQWLAALKDRDPSVRERAVNILGERSLDLAVPADERSRLGIAATSLLFSDKSAPVRQAAAFFADLQRLSHSPDRIKQALERRKRAVKPNTMTIRLIDTQGRPVTGGMASTFFQRDADDESTFTTPAPLEVKTADTRGELTLELEIPSHLAAAGVYAIRQEGDSPKVGMQRVSREEIREGKPVTIVMHPACRVRLRVECPALDELGKKYHAELGGRNWWRAAYVWLGEDHQSPRPLFTSSTTGQLEFLLPPGRFMIMAYGSDVKNEERTIEVKPGHRVLSLDVIEVAPSDAAKQGIFREHWRSIRRDPQAAEIGLDDQQQVVYRYPRSGPGPRGAAQQVSDVCYSPDGTFLATAHWYNADPGEVKLWDAKTGRLVAALPVAVPTGGVTTLAFSPDSKLLAGSVGQFVCSQRTGDVVLWDVAGRRELRTLRGHSARTAALAFAPDGKTLASGGADRTVRFWEVASGKETTRIDANPGSIQSLAYSPDGKFLAIGSGRTLKLWDVPGNRSGTTLEADGFLVHAVAFAPGGRTLAAAGAPRGAGKPAEEGVVRLYDLARVPPVRRAELTLDRDGPGQPNRFASDVAFTPDGRRVVAVAAQTIVIWDAASGYEQDSRNRGVGGMTDRIAISPNGQWLAATQPVGAGVSVLEIPPPLR